MPPAAKPMRRRLSQAHMAGDAARAAKSRAKRAYYACRADARLAPIGGRVWAETLQHAEGQNPIRAEAMPGRPPRLAGDDSRVRLSILPILPARISSTYSEHHFTQRGGSRESGRPYAMGRRDCHQPAST
jgi:hypothetical protein